ncbi:MAG: DUF1059 domain-containing protein [Candidatus Thermoplasmatota archaeon]|jgi:predicted small metal-binding protein|nr:DUF1059 domain-containing protein [Candidatus Thermoplasmatota archaeon]MCL5988558.1 DUF1059 domain-containing protein [Candidatus Thermoplasmatota archaeon]
MGKYRFKCENTGHKCGFHIEADSKDDLIPHIRAHASQHHDIHQEEHIQSLANSFIEKI